MTDCDVGLRRDIVCVGGGPAGMHLAISMKLRDPSTEMRVVERNRPYDTFGWGAVFSDQSLEHLRENDKTSAERIFDNPGRLQ